MQFQTFLAILANNLLKNNSENINIFILILIFMCNALTHFIAVENVSIFETHHLHINENEIIRKNSY